MKICLFPLLSFLIWSVFSMLPMDAAGSSLSLGPLETKYTGDAVSRVTTSAEQTANLSGTEGLTPGAPLLITVSFTEPLLWYGAFQYGAGRLEFQHTATVTLAVASAGEITGTASWGSVFTSTEPSGGPGVSGVTGYNLGPALNNLQLVAPWGTDLSSVSLRLAQDSRFMGGNGYFTQSSLITSLNTAVRSPAAVRLQVSSIPEPGCCNLMAFSVIMIFRRRKTQC